MWLTVELLNDEKRVSDRYVDRYGDAVQQQRLTLTFLRALDMIMEIRTIRTPGRRSERKAKEPSTRAQPLLPRPA